MVVDHTPLSSFVIGSAVAPSQLPFSVTSAALGADSRKVTVRSGWISGDRGITGRAAGAAAAGAAGAAGGCCARADPGTSSAASIAIALARAKVRCGETIG